MYASKKINSLREDKCLKCLIRSSFLGLLQLLQNRITYESNHSNILFFSTFSVFPPCCPELLSLLLWSPVVSVSMFQGQFQPPVPWTLLCRYISVQLGIFCSVVHMVPEETNKFIIYVAISITSTKHKRIKFQGFHYLLNPKGHFCQNRVNFQLKTHLIFKENLTL